MIVSPGYHRILIAAWPIPGHIHPTLAIAHALRARGHAVAFYTGASMCPLVRAEGFHCFPFQRVDEGVLRTSEPPLYSAPLLERLRAIPKVRAGLRAWLLDTVPGQVEDLEAIRADWPYELILTVESMWAPFLVLRELRGASVVYFSTLIACLLPGPDAPAWGLGLPRPRTRLMRWHSSVLRRIQRWLSADFLAAVTAVRARYGLPPLDTTVTELAGTLPLYLMPSVPELDYDRRDLPTSVHYVGPCSWDKPLSQPPPPWLATLPSSPPVIHVTEATIHHHAPFLLRAAARALGGLPLQVVMTTGGHRDPADLGLGELAANIRVERYVPHSDLMPKTSVLVTMGGSGTLFAALKHGVPLVVVPTEWDKPENAQRIVEAGAGLRLDPRRCTARRLREAVLRVLHEPGYRRQAQRLAAVCAAHGGATRVAELLERLLVTDSIMKSGESE